MQSEHGYAGLLTALGLAAAVLSGCATTATTQADCYPYIFLDSRYAIQGTSRESGGDAPDSNCYHFAYQDGRSCAWTTAGAAR